ncbi:hypothetical protein [Cellulomonas chengniuliangii]|uniref:Thymidine phosphorylase n=1 Tax=Cellulomonas chengniuliangii TaxID=2968084 RepID=A0ABY5L0J4_9CELL|nr:hypothetical protein [Cellulomonas chengniuliangii]MCC2309465.1 hypothetical protein [Cellulomonas chengniuliangii]MCC2316736.1 hypothetical protein [Cellulomonas chengniuliangii]UUI74976.1 hypothetical protein NP064_14505 [Cellulomonas chengniuliangii]
MSTSDGAARRPRRPARLDQQQAEDLPGGIDPAVRSEVAHTTAGAIVRQGRTGADDPELVERLVRLVEAEGLDVVAAMWADSPSATLPGALWRLYVLREWVRRDPRTVAERYRLGLDAAPVHDAVAGVASPPGPDEVREVADAVLSGVYAGDLAVALERGAAFCRVLATGAAFDADYLEATDDTAARRLTRGASSLVRTAEELEEAASLWRAEKLD